MYELLLVLMLFGFMRFIMKQAGGWFLTIPYILTVVSLWILTAEKLPMEDVRVGYILGITVMMLLFRYIYRTATKNDIDHLVKA